MRIAAGGVRRDFRACTTNTRITTLCEKNGIYHAGQRPPAGDIRVGNYTVPFSCSLLYDIVQMKLRRP